MASTIARGLVKCGHLPGTSPKLMTRGMARRRGPHPRTVITDFSHPVYMPGGIYEPDYLPKLQPPTEQYKTLDIDIKGYDYPVVKRYNKYVFKVFRDLGLEYLDSYGHPNQVVDVDLLKTKSETLQETYHTRIYKRTMQFDSVPVYKIGLLIDVLHATAPPGVTFLVEVHSDEKEENRYVPDIDLAETKRNLESLVENK